jgi:arsenical pump membrane protein
MPSLLQWLPRYALPSCLSIAATFLVLRWTQRTALRQKVAADVPVPHLSRAAIVAAIGIAATSVALLMASAFDIQLGLPTALAGIATAAIVLISERKAPWVTVKGISWSVLPLVAGLFVLVEALDYTGLIHALSAFLQDRSAHAAGQTAWGAGIVIAFISNLMNNLPVGLIAGSAVQSAHVPEQVTSAILIGVDLGPNLSVTGSLATILWLTALRRDGQNVGAVTFLKIGCLVMPPALIAALAGALWL